jgi:CheY-like chemotaxis protein
LHEENTLIQEIAPLRILIIEDTEERQKILTSLYRSHAWILVNTGHRAITLLKAYDFDIICPVTLWGNYLRNSWG